MCFTHKCFSEGSEGEGDENARCPPKEGQPPLARWDILNPELAQFPEILNTLLYWMVNRDPYNGLL